MSEPLIYGALAMAQGQVGAIAKEHDNREQGFKFRSIDQILATAKPIFAELGIAVRPIVTKTKWSPVVSGRGSKGWRCTMTVTYAFTATDGSELRATVASEAIDYGDKSTTKALQIAFKYALTQVLMVGSDEPDNDSESPEAGEVMTAEELILRTTNGLKAYALELTDDDKEMAAELFAEALEVTGLGDETITMESAQKVRDALDTIAGAGGSE
jgi:ERF superfamily